VSLINKLIIIALLFVINVAHACGTCYGDPNSSAVNGMNWAIISLLATTGGVLSGISFSIFSIAKKSKNMLKKKKVKSC
tara:strand:- start:461 stop:697 length:237 start_codon:yes stop_codon:yes gene_type:complete